MDLLIKAQRTKKFGLKENNCRIKM